MKTTSISGREFKSTPNHAKRTFTIHSNGTKYRTSQMGKDEFQACLDYTGNDWQNFLRTGSYTAIAPPKNRKR